MAKIVFTGTHIHDMDGKYCKLCGLTREQIESK